MITDSSKNYLDNTLTLVFDDVEPTVEEIFDYCIQHYSGTPTEIDIEPANEGYGGYTNPGIVKVQLAWN